MCVLRHYRGGRLIPVLTGNRLCLASLVLMIAVNPRAYGEQFGSSFGSISGGG